MIVLLFLSLTIIACKEKEDDPEPMDPGTPVEIKKGTFAFHLHSYIDESEVDLYNIPYQTLDGRTISLSLAQLYISEIEAEHTDGSFHPVESSVVLKVLDKET